MILKYVTTALVGSLLVSGAAFAQSPAPQRDASPSSVMQRSGDWRASKLVGVDVYNEANEKIGDISDVILDNSGKVTNVILGVGGFLGIGEHYVAVGFDKLKWSERPVRETSASASGTKSPATNVDSNARTAADGSAGKSPATSPGMTTGAAVSSTSKDWHPDHVVFNASKEQLKAMPQFRY